MTLSACSSGISFLKQRSARGFIEVLKASDEREMYIRIDNPFLSFDGRFMAVDFKMASLEGREDGTLTRQVAVYDFEKNEFEIISPFGEEIGVHSPSFNLKADKLVMVSECFKRNVCDARIIGNQIVVYNLNTKSIAWVSNNANPSNNYKKVKLRLKNEVHKEKINEEAAGHVVRGYPVFGINDDEIYNVVGPSHLSHIYFKVQLNGDFNLKKFQKIKNNPEVWRNELLINAPDQRGVFIGGGRLSATEDGRVLLPVGYRINEIEGPLTKKTISSFFYNAETDRIEIAFDETNSPEFISSNRRLSSRRLNRQVVSRDGSKILSQGAYARTLLLHENGSFRRILNSEDIMLSKFADMHISGDGKWAVVFPPGLFYDDNDDLRFFWRLNLETGERQKLPLRIPLKEKIRQYFKAKTGVSNG